MTYKIKMKFPGEKNINKKNIAEKDNQFEVENSLEELNEAIEICLSKLENIENKYKTIRQSAQIHIEKTDLDHVQLKKDLIDTKKTQEKLNKVNKLLEEKNFENENDLNSLHTKIVNLQEENSALEKEMTLLKDQYDSLQSKFNSKEKYIERIEKEKNVFEYIYDKCFILLNSETRSIIEELYSLYKKELNNAADFEELNKKKKLEKKLLEIREINRKKLHDSNKLEKQNKQLKTEINILNHEITEMSKKSVYNSKLIDSKRSPSNYYEFSQNISPTKSFKNYENISLFKSSGGTREEIQSYLEKSPVYSTKGLTSISSKRMLEEEDFYY